MQTELTLGYPEVVPNKHVFIVTYACSLNGQFNPYISHEHKSVGLFNPVEASPQQQAK
jgi:hypothetical protein